MLSRLSSPKHTSSVITLSRILDVLILFIILSATFSKTPDLSQVAVRHVANVVCWSGTAFKSDESCFDDTKSYLCLFNLCLSFISFGLKCSMYSFI